MTQRLESLWGTVEHLLFQSYIGPSLGEDNRPARGREKIKCLKNMKKVTAAWDSMWMRKKQKHPERPRDSLGPWVGAGTGCWLASGKDHIWLCFPQPKGSATIQNTVQAGPTVSVPTAMGFPSHLFVRWHLAQITLQLCPHAQATLKKEIFALLHPVAALNQHGRYKLHKSVLACAGATVLQN